MSSHSCEFAFKKNFLSRGSNLIIIFTLGLSVAYIHNKEISIYLANFKTMIRICIHVCSIVLDYRATYRATSNGQTRKSCEWTNHPVGLHIQQVFFKYNRPKLL